jgi:hypothetical protein
MQRRAAWVVAGVLGAAALYDVALALGAGSSSIRHFHHPPGASVVGIAVVLAVVAALALCLWGVARPTRTVALFAPLWALFLFVGDFTYDEYDAPQLDRYWNNTTAHGRMVTGVFVGLAVGAFAYRWPRAGAAVTFVALPVVFMLTIAYFGH